MTCGFACQLTEWNKCHRSGVSFKILQIKNKEKRIMSKKKNDKNQKKRLNEASLKPNCLVSQDVQKRYQQELSRYQLQIKKKLELDSFKAA